MRRLLMALTVMGLLLPAIPASAAGPCTLAPTGPTTNGVNIYGTMRLDCSGVGRIGDWVKVEIWEDDTWPDPDDLKSSLTNNGNAVVLVVNDSWNCDGTGLQTYYLKGSGRDTAGGTYAVQTGNKNLNC